MGSVARGSELEMEQSRLEKEDGDWADPGIPTGADEVTILASTPLLVPTLPLEVEQTLVVAVVAVKHVIADCCCKVDVGLSGNSVTRKVYIHINKCTNIDVYMHVG